MTKNDDWLSRKVTSGVCTQYIAVNNRTIVQIQNNECLQ